ncbi:hypothetical protein IPM44_02835 [bacterium]|nr:MAG: hypothetical protein IPM44_02835 [bacterium]
METTLFILIIVMSIAVLVLLGIMIAVFIATKKLLKTVQYVAELAQDGTKTATDIVHEIKDKIINPVTMSAIFAQVMRATSGNKRKRR